MKKVHLKKININRISKEYETWMNDWEIIKFTEQRFKKTSIKDIKNYLKKINNSKSDFIYGIYIKDRKNDIHIGNIKIGSINFYHKRAEISYFIGNKFFWNKGVGKKAINLILNIAKNKFKLKKIIAGVYSLNRSSINVLLSNGFKKEATLKSHIVFNNKRYNSYIYGYVFR